MVHPTKVCQGRHCMVRNRIQGLPRFEKQDVVIQSTAKVEFITAVADEENSSWSTSGSIQIDSTKVFVDNQAPIAISNNSSFHENTKQFNVKLYFLIDVPKGTRSFIAKQDKRLIGSHLH